MSLTLCGDRRRIPQSMKDKIQPSEEQRFSERSGYVQEGKSSDLIPPHRPNSGDNQPQIPGGYNGLPERPPFVAMVSMGGEILFAKKDSPTIDVIALHEPVNPVFEKSIKSVSHHIQARSATSNKSSGEAA